MALLLLITSFFVCVAPIKANVYNNKREIIGEAIIPHDNEKDYFLFFAFTVLTGIQFWTVLVLGKEMNKKSQPND